MTAPAVLNLYAVLAGDTSSLRPRAARPATKAKKRRAGPSEAQIQAAILAALRLHPAVAWVGRYNSGALRDGRAALVRFHTVDGHSDLLGMLKGGRLFAVEVKRPGERPTERQAAFLARVAAAGGLAGVATGVDEALALVAGAAA